MVLLVLLLLEYPLITSIIAVERLLEVLDRRGVHTRRVQSALCVEELAAWSGNLLFITSPVGTIALVIHNEAIEFALGLTCVHAIDVVLLIISEDVPDAGSLRAVLAMTLLQALELRLLLFWLRYTRPNEFEIFIVEHILFLALATPLLALPPSLSFGVRVVLFVIIGDEAYTFLLNALESTVA
jgi:hypothetical protein